MCYPNVCLVDLKTDAILFLSMKEINDWTSTVIELQVEKNMRRKINVAVKLY